MIRLVIAALLLVPQGATAQDDAQTQAAAQNMQLAAELCLRNYRTETDLPEAFTSAGFTLSRSHDAEALDFDAFGVSGGFVPDPARGYCYAQSGSVPLALAEAIGRAVSDRLFPGQVAEGRPERNVNAPLRPCEGLQIFAPQQLITISYAAAGNSGDCVNDGTSAIIINM